MLFARDGSMLRHVLIDHVAGLADYTEVNDKVFLGKSANKAAARRMRGEIGEMIEERWVSFRSQIQVH